MKYYQTTPKPLRQSNDAFSDYKDNATLRPLLKGCFMQISLQSNCSFIKNGHIIVTRFRKESLKIMVKDFLVWSEIAQ